MAQYRQFGGGGSGSRNGGLRHFNHGRSKQQNSDNTFTGFCVLILSLIILIYILVFIALLTQGNETNGDQNQVDDLSMDMDIIMDVTSVQNSRELRFGNSSVSRTLDWDKDGRTRDEDYNAPVETHTPSKPKDKVSYSGFSNAIYLRGNGLRDEAGCDVLKNYVARLAESTKNTEDYSELHDNRHHVNGWSPGELGDPDEYDDGFDSEDDQNEELGIDGYDEFEGFDDAAYDTNAFHPVYHIYEDEMASAVLNEINETQGSEVFADLDSSESLKSHDKGSTVSGSGSSGGHLVKKMTPEKKHISKKKPKRQKNSGSCEMNFAKSSPSEPLESKKFARFSLNYSEREEANDEKWEPRFAGHQSLTEREESFIARDQKLNCGFVKGPKESPSTGFDLAEDDVKYISSCRIAVMSCIFGNSDRLRSPIGKMVSRFSKKNVCFVMFVDVVTLETLSSEGQKPDTKGFIGLWKIVVVKNLPYMDMRRVGKIPKLLAHRLFSSARYSIWLDSKLHLELDPLLILEYFLWRKDREYAISDHYDRHCLWDEVAQNKKLNKYNHSVIDEQFAFYQADGMKRFNASDPKKLLPSNVPEASFIVRAHTPMSNLFSCLWFNEVDRFTPRDQLSFAYTYHKLTKTNPEKSFHLNMFKNCERRKVTKLYRHRSEEKGNVSQQET